MSPGHTDTRERMLNSAAELMREHGASGTSIDDVLAHSGAPRGSVYHHFPGGRTQMIEEAVASTGDSVSELIALAGPGAAPDAVFDAFLASWRESLKQSEFRSGCPVLAVAVEHHERGEELVRTAGEVFGDWQAALAAHLREHGVSPARARRLATVIVAAVEGAVALCRTEHDTRPLDDVGRELRGLLTEAIADSG
jgi:AcrR family transcriptional regulator